MKRKVITTADGSTTIHLEEWNEQYHSKHGAVQEAYHVFIKNGLSLFKASTLNILEIGFGTGLNALITFKEAQNLGLKINYDGVEAYPVAQNELEQLNYSEALAGPELDTIFSKMHNALWDEVTTITHSFQLHKRKQEFKYISDNARFHLIYFDAFGPRVQPELWTIEIFQKMYNALLPNGVLTTYSAKGEVRRNMEVVGFTVERLPGPPGKREMLRATKPEG